MTRTSKNRNLTGGGRILKSAPRGNSYGQPFWLPPSSFYVLAVAVAVAVFFLVWGVLHEGGEAPWVTAGVFASLILVGAVILREVVFRNRRRQLLLAQERLDFNLKKVYRQSSPQNEGNKLTLEQNASILKQITQKSEAANVLAKFSEAHWEVFELCDEYLHRSEKELETVRAGSPRLNAINQGREQVRYLHRLHLLAWSSAQSRELIHEAKASATISKKLEVAAKALDIIDSAIQFYPDEGKLVESRKVIKEFIASVKVSHWVEQAERFAFKGNYKRAINNYRDALFYLARENVRDEERDLIAAKINFEIEKIKKLSAEKNGIKFPFEGKDVTDDE